MNRWRRPPTETLDSNARGRRRREIRQTPLALPIQRELEGVAHDLYSRRQAVRSRRRGAQCAGVWVTVTGGADCPVQFVRAYKRFLP